MQARLAKMHFVNVNKIQIKLCLYLMLALISTMTHAASSDSPPQSKSSRPHRTDGPPGGHDPATGTLLYYGWFFDASIANSVKKLYADYLTKMYTEVPAAKSFLDAVAAANNVTDPLNKYFAKPSDPATGKDDPYFHVTSMYCGGDIDCSDYTARVKPYLDKPFNMHLIGVFFTERTFGVRVLLTEEQEELMNEDTKSAGQLLGGHTRHIVSDYPGIVFEGQDQNYSPSQSKAHITLGCAPEVSAVVTGHDLLDIVKFEAEAAPGNYEEHTLEGLGVLRHYNPNGPSNQTAFALYPYQKAMATAKFQDYYMPPSSPSQAPAAATGTDYFTLSQKLSVALLILWILHGLFRS